MVSPPVNGLFGPDIERITRAFTRRSGSLFQTDCDTCESDLRRKIEGSRVLVSGGAGSIGSSTIMQLIRFAPSAVCVLDPNENGLAELVRDIRSSEVDFKGELYPAPLDYGSTLTRSFLEKQPPFDYVLSFAALKHVRSERDEFSVLRMLDVNLVCADRFLSALRQNGHGKSGVFFVSTDKAARPVNLMGASKRAMEALLWAHTASGAPASCLDGGSAPALSRATTTRFANVAFSDGSLPWGFLQRLRKRQPLAVPEGIRRFFISPLEAAQLCLLAAFSCPSGNLLIPRLDPASDLVPMTGVARATLEDAGLEPCWYRDAVLAKASLETDFKQGKYPALLTGGDTMGEKEDEEFLADGESPAVVSSCGKALESVLSVAARSVSPGSLASLLHTVNQGVTTGIVPAKSDLVKALAAVVPEFLHRETGKALDARM